MAVATDLRLQLAASLTAAGVPAFASMPHSINPPVVAFTAADPYLRIDRVGATLQYEINLYANLIVPVLDSEGSLLTLETLIDSVLRALPPGVYASDVSAPRVDRLGDAQGSVLIADLAITAQGKETA